MREDYPSWLAAQGYSDNTCTSRVSGIRKIERAYGETIEATLAQGRLDTLLKDLTYSKRDERQNQPNPSRFEINGNIFNGLATIKTALMLYLRFLGADDAIAGVHVDGQISSDVDNITPPRPNRATSETDTAERQRLSLERDMQNALRQNIAQLDPGLTIIDDGAERAVDSGFIDILARDSLGAIVVIELKAGKTDNRVIGQTLGYMGDIAVEYDNTAVRGIIVAHEFDQRTRSAARAVSNLSLVRYAVSFTFEPEA